MRTMIILVMSLLVTGCGSSSDKETVGKEIADDYNEAMDKAREVEDKLQEHKEDIDKALEEVEKSTEDQETQ